MIGRVIEGRSCTSELLATGFSSCLSESVMALRILSPSILIVSSLRFLNSSAGVVGSRMREKAASNLWFSSS
jgi:hypothetical protein